MDFSLTFYYFLFLWLIVDCFNLLFFGYLWQLKEYRLDRIATHFRTGKGRKDLVNFFSLGKIFLSLEVCLFSRFISEVWLEKLLIGFLFFELSGVVFNFFKRRLKRPLFTPKVVLMMIMAFFFQGLFLFSFVQRTSLFWLGNSFLSGVFLAVNILLPFWIGLASVVLSLPTRVFKRRIINRARLKLAGLPSLIVVGITGSFGKTSTKEYLTTILGKHFKTLSTFKHHNTPIAIAKQIINDLNDQHRVYVVEMGAYKKGEIAEICGLVSPKIGVITGIGKQHLSLFGSFNALIRAKFELIDSLPGDGLVVLNGDDKFCLKMGSWTRLKKLIYSQDKRRADLSAGDIKVFKEKVIFEVKKSGEKQVFKAPLLGRHNVSNLLAAIGVATHLGMTLSEIARRVKMVSGLSGTLGLKRASSGLCLVDDTYNSNPDGVLASLSYLRVFSGKRIMIFQPMIELGRETGFEHKRVFRKAIRVCDLIFLTNENFYQEIINSVVLNQRKKVVLITSGCKQLDQVFSSLGEKDVVLFEGREAGKFLKDKNV